MKKLILGLIMGLLLVVSAVGLFACDCGGDTPSEKAANYTVRYLWQNIDDDDYSLHESEVKKGKVGKTVTAEIKNYDHFNVVEDTVSGIVMADGSTVLNVYYDREVIFASFTAKNGEQVIGEPTAINRRYGTTLAALEVGYLCYDFDGWYLNGNSVQTSTVIEQGAEYIAQCSVNEEMLNYNFSVNPDGAGCVITGVIDKTLSQYNIPSYVVGFGENSFDGCSDSIRLNYLGTASGWAQVDGLATQYYAELYIKGAPVTEISLQGITEIKSCAFYGCTELVNVTIGSSVKTIGASAFRNCTALTDIGIPDSVETIRYYAFRGCTSLKNIAIGNGLTEIGDMSFDGCPAENVAIPAIAIPYLSKTALKTLVISGGEQIPANTFKDCTYLQSVTINDVEIIGANAFDSCYALQTVVLSDTVKEIGDYAFTSCMYLMDLTLGGVEKIGEYAFNACENLTEVKLNNNIKSIGKSAFANCSELDYNEYENFYYLGSSSNAHIALIKPKTSGIKVLKMHADVKIVVDGALSGCNIETAEIPTFAIGLLPQTSLKTVKITSGSAIPESAFENCTTLESVTFDSYVSEIGNGAFNGCTSLKEVFIPDSVETLGSYVFYNCTALQSVSIGSNVSVIDLGTFLLCANLKYVNMYGTVNQIKENAFNGCTSLETIYYNGTSAEFDGITVGGYNTAFTNATCRFVSKGLAIYLDTDNTCYIGGIGTCTDTDIVFPVYSGSSPVVSIAEEAFKGNTNITSIVVGYKTEEIKTEAFRGCTALINALIPEGVRKIGDRAFFNCTALNSAVIPDSVSQVGNAAFSLTGIRSIKIGNGLETVSYSMCSDCSNLTNIIFGTNVQMIDDFAFWGCTSLKRVTVPGTVKTIDRQAFYNCSALEYVRLENGVETLNGSVFSNCVNLKVIYLPDSVTFIDSLSLKNTAIETAYVSMKLIAKVPTTVKTLVLTDGNGITADMSAFVALEKVLFKGNATDWANVTMSSETRDAIAPMLYLYNATERTDGNYWHYGNDGITAFVWEVYSKGLEYGLDNETGTLIVTGIGTCTDTVIIIPCYYNGVAVTKIAENAFKDNSSITAVTFGENVSEIGLRAFNNCTALQTVKFGKNIKVIDDMAFATCTGLTDVYVDLTETQYLDADVYIGGLNNYLTGAEWHYKN